jgi:hypothetical protein
MTKEDIEQKIKKARQSHTYQIQKIKFLVEGVPLKEDPTPVSYKECGFGSWIYGNEEQLRQLIGSNSFEEIEEKHILWHTEYQKIYQIYYGEAKKGLLSKFLGGKPKVDSLQQDRAKAYYSDLESMTGDLLSMLDSLQRRISLLPESKFNKS